MRTKIRIFARGQKDEVDEMAEKESKRIGDWLVAGVLLALTAMALLLIFADMQGLS